MNEFAEFAKPQNEFSEFANSNADYDAGSVPVTNQHRKLEQESEEKRQKYIESRRFELNEREAFHQSERGRRILDNKFGAFERAEIKQLEKMRSRLEANGVDVDALIKEKDAIAEDKWNKAREERLGELREYMELPNWQADPNFGSRVAKMFTSLGGQVFGGMQSPEGFVPTGKGATVARTFLKGGAVNAAVNLGTDYESQQQGIRIGTQEKLDPVQQVMSAGIGMGVGGTANVLGHHYDFKPQTQNLGPSGEALSPIEIKAKQQADAMAAREQQARAEANWRPEEVMEGEGGIIYGEDRTRTPQPDPNQYPEIDNEFQVFKTLDESQASAMKEIDDQAPLDEIMYGTDAVGNEKEPRYKKDLPKIKKDFVVEDTSTPDPRFAEDTPPIENGFGPDLIENPLETAPFMPGRLAEQANVDQVPGSHEMQFLPGDADPNAHLGISGKAQNPYASQPHVDAVNEANRTAIPDSKEPLQGTHKMGFREGKAETPHEGGNIISDADRAIDSVSGGRSITDAEASKMSSGEWGAYQKAKTELQSSRNSLVPRLRMHYKNLSEASAKVGTPEEGHLTKAAIEYETKQIEKIEQKLREKINALNDSIKSVRKPDETPITLDSQEITPESVDFAEKIRQVKTMGEALEVVAATGGDSYEAQMARAILSKAPERNTQPLTKEQLLTEGQSGVVRTTAGSGEVEFSIDPRAMLYASGPEVIIHEATHVKTNDALYAYAAGNATPEQAAYAKSIHDLFKHIQNKHPDLKDTKWMKNLNEFNAYGLTDPQFIDLLDKTNYRGSTAWDKFVTAIMNFVGMDPGQKTAYKALVKKMADWDKIQGTAESRGESVRINQERLDKTKALLKVEAPMLSKSQADAYARKMVAHHGQFASPSEARTWLDTAGPDEMQDLKFSRSGLFVTQNQNAMMSDKNPIVAHVFNHLSDRQRLEDARMHGYDEQLKPAIDWAEKNVDAAVKFFTEWEKLNVDPQQRGLRSHLENDPNAFMDYFRATTFLKPDEIKALKPFMDVMKDLQGYDGKTLTDSMGRTLNNEPLYFPLARSGPYHFQITDAAGGIKFAGGFRSLAEAKKTAANMKQTMPADHQMTDVIRTDPTRVLNPAIAEAIMQQNPDWFHKYAMNTYEAKMEYRRNFEKGRANDIVGGYIGETTPVGMKERLGEYLEALSHRIRDSHHLGNHAAAVELSHALLTPGSKLSDYPNTHGWVNTMVARHVGLDISKWGPIDDALRDLSLTAGKGLTKIDAALKGYEPGKNNVIPPHFPKVFLQSFSALASVWKIALNAHVMAGNAVTNGTMPLEGARNLARMGIVDPTSALAAQMDAMAYMASLGSLNEHAWVKAKMEQATREGMIDPRGREDRAVVENINQFHVDKRNMGMTERAVQGAMTAVQKPRDWIEMGTNWNAILYNHFLVKRAFPELSEANHDRVVYNLARSFTGDYSKQANLMGFEKMGTLGHMSNQFAKWKFNRTSRYLDDLIMASRMEELGPRAIVPFLYSTAIGMVMAGAYGAMGVADYEAIRRFGTMTGLFDLKPFSAILSDSGLLDNLGTTAKDIAERGVVTAFSNQMAMEMGESSGPDISGSLREASAIEPPLVGVNVAKELFGAAAFGMKYAASRQIVTDFVNSLPEGKIKEIAKGIQDMPSYGITSDEGKAVIRALPKVLQETYKEQFIKEVEIDGKKKFIVPELAKDKGAIMRDEFQQKWAKYGAVMTDENRAQEMKQYNEWQKRKGTKEHTALKDGIINNLDNEKLVDRNARIIFEKFGQAAYEGVIQELEDIFTEKMQTDYAGNEQLAISRNRDAIAAFRAAERLKRSMKLMDKGVHELRTGPLSTSEEWSEARGIGLAKESFGNDVTPDKADYAPTKNYSIIDAALPNLRARGYKGSAGVRGFMRNTDENDMVFVNTDKYGSPKERDYTLLHESEHILQKKGMKDGEPPSINLEFDKLVGDDGASRKEITKALTRPNVREYLKNNWGIDDSYFDPKMYEIQGSRAKNLLYEQFASLAAGEHMKGVEADLTKDPFLRKHVFDTAAKREAFRAMTGLRQTRLDAKDLRPYTRVKEKDTEDDTVIGYIKKKILKGE